MGNLSKNIIYASLTLLLIAAVFSSFLKNTKDKPRELALGEVASLISENKVKSILVEGEKVTATLNDESKVQSRKEVEGPLTQSLSDMGVSGEQLRKTPITVKEPDGAKFWMSVLLPTLLPVLLLAGIIWWMMRGAKSGVNQAFNFGRANIKLSVFGKEKIKFSDVAGSKEAKEELAEVVDFLKNPKKYLDIGARIPRGVLLVGLPGTGKTMLARAVAGESNVPFFHIPASEFVEMFVGVGASRIRDAFTTARRAAPSILFIDEIDAVGRQRGAGLGGGNDEREQTLNQILVELDGFEREAQVIVLAATNRPDVLDPALLRPGRFDRRVILDLPDLADREAILKIHARDKKLESSVDLKKIAIRTPGFSGADLANIMNEGAILAARRESQTIAQIDMYEAIEKVMMGPERRNRAISEKERDITAYHEGGHALVSASLKESDPIHKVTIVSRGFAGGYTMKLPIEDRHLKTRKQFLAELAMMLGGYAAEELLYQDTSTGASNDLKEATALARKLVTKYGMSELGPISFGDSQEMVFLGREIATEKNYSDKTGEKIDEQISKFISEAHETAKRILKANHKALDEIARVLKEKETLEQDEFYDLLKPFKIKQID